ncbi:XshC-Cox1 family protein [Rudanella paleaurantiibacter]|uniref:XshC-Cox1 family protein n=1 Tax=Rudanella paleaurantiibacter TaxID=2614655 RepID=A0A7J5U1P6_9BACT|nr:XdhC family protein [Rudanella paleaurantiibacter]KAB7731606.1 XshC-Cox1 family protein [Rudanella paleaurantiibacter]
MKEIKAIINAYDAKSPETKAALATVVRVEGSSYRRTGARMLIMDNGTWVGGISGGCLEGDALKRARLAISQAKPTLITYDTTQDDAYQIGVGLGCNGVIDVLISPIDADAPKVVELLRSCLTANRQTHVLLTVTQASDEVDGLSTGDMFRYNGPDSLAQLADETAIASATEKIERYIQKGKSAPVEVLFADGRVVELFVEVMPPIPHVVLLGQQYDVYPLVRILNELGWQSTVVANPQKVTQALFGAANALVAPADFDTISVDGQTAFVLMAHDFKTDKANLPRALATDAPFVGVLGPRVRTERMLSELAEEGTPIAETDRMHAPIGLDIGATSPEEIALSIVAEIRAVLSGRSGSFLRLRQAPIHERD